MILRTHAFSAIQMWSRDSASSMFVNLVSTAKWSKYWSKSMAWSWNIYWSDALSKNDLLMSKHWSKGI
jgi:hypothetical protein